MECPDETTLSDFLAGWLPEVRRAQVLAHVEDCSRCERALAEGEDFAATVDLPDASFQDGAPLLARGAMLLRYRVLERIGSGAMGVVYAAYDPELDRKVALKVLRPAGRNVPELRVRLQREAQSLARLSHPNVVTVHDVGICGEGVFLALELVDGTTLADWLKEPRPWPELLRVFIDAGRGLAAAHAAGLVHRDFKPTNVLVGRDGRGLVTDFGLARSTGPASAPPDGLAALELASGARDSASITRTGAVLGTPAYMAPEQTEGRGADALSDQFSFCVALHEALYGVRTFEDGPGRDTKVPAWVRQAVLRGLQRRPEERFPSMEALLAALAPRPRRVRAWVAASAALASLLGVAVGYGGAHRREVRCAHETEKLAAAWGPERRDRVRAAFSAVGKPWAATAWDKLSAELDAYASQWSALRGEACRAADDTSGTAWQTAACLDRRLWQLTAVTEVLEKADVKTVQNAHQMVASLEGLTGCRDAPEDSSRPQPPDVIRPQVDAARQRLAEAEARGDAGRHAEGIQMTSALLLQVQPLGFRPLEAEVLSLHGRLHVFTGDLKEAEGILYRALWAAEAGRDDETIAHVWLHLLWVVGDRMARVDEADKLAQHARAAVERLGPERFPDLVMRLHLRVGGVLLMQGRLMEADEELIKGLELSRKASGVHRRVTAELLVTLGRVRSRQGRSSEALALYRQGLELREQLLGPEHPGLVLTLNNIGSQLLLLGQREEAVATLRRALKVLDAADSGSQFLAPPLVNLAEALRTQGRLDEARQYLQRAFALLERAKGPNHPHTVTALNGLGLLAYDAQRFHEAIALQQQALERIQHALGPDTPEAAASLRLLGRAQLRMGRHDEAKRSLTRALNLLEKANGQDSPTLTPVLRDLAQLALKTGAPWSALAHCQRALRSDEQVQGASEPDLALDLTCIAEAHLALQAPEQAAPLLERARQMHAHAPADPLDQAWATFLLARALRERRASPDRARSAALAEEARARLNGLGVRALEELREITDWQARHLSGSPSTSPAD